MRSMQWQLGKLGTISAFAFRHRETKRHRERLKKTNNEYFYVLSAIVYYSEIYCKGS
jgi:hypothetical protein